MTADYRTQHAPIVVVAFGGRVIGMHADTGERVWENQIGSAYLIRVLVEGPHVVAFAYDTLTCLDYATGAQIWSVKVDRAFIGQSATMLVYGRRVVCADAGEAAAYDIQTGQLLWHDEFKGYGLHHVALAAPGTSAQVDRRGS